MTRNKVLIALIMFCLIGTFTFAATVVTGDKKVAYELLGTDRTVQINTIAVTLETNVISNDFLTISLDSGLEWYGDCEDYYLIAKSSTNPYFRINPNSSAQAEWTIVPGGSFPDVTGALKFRATDEGASAYYASGTVWYLSYRSTRQLVGGDGYFPLTGSTPEDGGQVFVEVDSSAVSNDSTYYADVNIEASNGDPMQNNEDDDADQDVVTVDSQFTATYAKVTGTTEAVFDSDRTIDVYQDRLYFTDDDHEDENTESRGSVTLVAGTGFDYYIPDSGTIEMPGGTNFPGTDSTFGRNTWESEMTVTYSLSNTAGFTSGLEADNLEIITSWGATPVADDTTWALTISGDATLSGGVEDDSTSLTSTKVEWNGSDMIPGLPALGGTEYIVHRLDLNGTSNQNPLNIDFDGATFDFDSASYNDFTAAAATNAHIWEINGTQFRSAFFYFKYTHTWRFINYGNEDAELKADVYFDGGTYSCLNISMGTVPDSDRLSLAHTTLAGDGFWDILEDAEAAGDCSDPTGGSGTFPATMASAIGFVKFIVYSGDVQGLHFAYDGNSEWNELPMEKYNADPADAWWYK
jgi:hypothetical protein